MADVGDFISIHQNMVLAINGLTSAYLKVNGAAIFENITVATVVKNSAGRVARVSIVVAGTTAGSIYDCASTLLTGTANLIAVIGNTVGVTEISLPVNTGIVVTPGSGMVLSVSYS